MKITKPLLAILFIAALLSCPSLTVAAEKPAPQEITAKMSCGVCGMYPARFPAWQTQIIFTDGTMVPFDGSKDMFKYLLNLEYYNPGKGRDDVAAIWVREHSGNKWIDGETAYYLVGSSVMGPMGKDLIPFANAGEADGLRTEKGGTVMPFSEISKEVIDNLGAKMGVM